MSRSMDRLARVSPKFRIIGGVQRIALRKMACKYRRWALRNKGGSPPVRPPGRVHPSQVWKCRLCLRVLRTYWERDQAAEFYCNGIDRDTFVSEHGENDMEKVFVEERSYRLALQFFYAGGFATLRGVYSLAAASVWVARTLDDRADDRLYPIVSSIVSQTSGVARVHCASPEFEGRVEKARRRLLKAIGNRCRAYPSVALEACAMLDLGGRPPERQMQFRADVRDGYTSSTAIRDTAPRNCERLLRSLCREGRRQIVVNVPRLRCPSPEY